MAWRQLREALLLKGFDEEEREIMLEQLAHGKAVRQERARAQAEGREPAFTPLLQQWGGVSLVYRKNLIDSPAYRLNHEEVEKSLEEGIHCIERMAPKAALTDRFGALRAMTFERQKVEGTKWSATGSDWAARAHRLRRRWHQPQRTPSTKKEHPGTFVLGKGGFFAPHQVVHTEDGPRVEPAPGGFFTSYQRDGHVVSYYGDNNPKYAGSVVKAMASPRMAIRRCRRCSRVTWRRRRKKCRRTPRPVQRSKIASRTGKSCART